MKKRSQQNILFLKFLSSCEGEQRKSIIQTTTENQLRLLVEIIHNLVQGIIPIQTRNKQLLQLNKENIRKVVEVSVSIKLRRKRLININRDIPIIIQAFFKYESRIGLGQKTEV